MKRTAMASKTHIKRVQQARRTKRAAMAAEGLAMGVHADEMEWLRRLSERVLKKGTN